MDYEDDHIESYNLGWLKKLGLIILMIIMLGIGGVVGTGIGKFWSYQEWTKEAVDRDYGLYHPKTGKFIWKSDFEKLKD